MNDESTRPTRWETFRFSVVGPLLAAPPPRGELQSAIKYGFVQATGGILAPHCLPDSVHAREAAGSAQYDEFQSDSLDVRHLARRLVESGQTDIYHQVQSAVDRVLFEEVLRHVEGNQVLASRLLGISRTTLRTKLASLDQLENDEDRRLE